MPPVGHTAGFQQILNDVRNGRLTNQELTTWIMSEGPTTNEVSTILGIAKNTQPRVKLYWTVVGGKIASLINNPATQPLAPNPLGPNPTNPLDPGGGSAPSGSDWQHLLVRIAEFVIGAALVIVGIQAVVVKSKPGQTVIQTAGTVAKVVK